MDAKQISLMFKALSDEVRVNIMLQLMSGEQCACNLMKEQKLTQPALSHHMKIMCSSGLVEGRRIGRWMHYALSEQGTYHAQQFVQKLNKVSKRDPFEDLWCC